VSASRSAQSLDQVAIPPVDARGASVPKVVDLDALRLAPFPVVHPRAAREVVPYREPTFDELLDGWGVQAARGRRRGRPRWFRRHRVARGSGGTGR
jgi:hypothetical protein